jgi:ArsR family transcriptional regulator, lead/cadmium/zinc/bismuth-responsive transcriptional repressor
MIERRHEQSSGAPRISDRAGPAFSEEMIETLATTLRVLADPTRIRLLEVLNSRGQATVSALSDCLPLTQQGVSHQLGILRRAGIVRRRREGVWVNYELCDWTGWWLVEQLAGGLADADS